MSTDFSFEELLSIVGVSFSIPVVLCKIFVCNLKENIWNIFKNSTKLSSKALRNPQLLPKLQIFFGNSIIIFYPIPRRSPFFTIIGIRIHMIFVIIPKTILKFYKIALRFKKPLKNIENRMFIILFYNQYSLDRQ